MDFLKKFVSGDGGGCGDGGGGGGSVQNMKENLDEENIELSLGLSLNGQFGIERRRMDNNNNNGILARANSVVDFTLNEGPTTSLMRTSSLPLEMEEEWKKRKELQSIRRLEAKRKRVEKMKNGSCENVKKKCSPSVASLPPRPVGSPASGGSSGVSDLESQHVSGTNKDIDSKSTNSQQSVSQQITSSCLYRSNSVASKPASEKFTVTPSQTTHRNHSKDETLKMMLSDMPCVSTKGDGVNGNKIEGFLYRYRKGEEVRIVCVCHGSFLTPAEFVKHGGGGDVEHPLRHIVVNPPSL